MKKNRRGCVVTSILLGGLAFILLLIAVYAIYIAPKTLEDKQLAASPPSVIVHFPTTGENVSVGTLLPASATATGLNPIVLVELWLNGEPSQQQFSDSAAGVGSFTFRANFEFEVTEGSQLLVLRAIDSKGLVGQSVPITIAGIQNSGADDIIEPLAQDGEQNNDQPQGDGANQPPQGGGGAGGGQQGGGDKPPNAKQPDKLPDTPGVTYVDATMIPAIDFAKLFPVFLNNYPKAPSSLQVGFEDCTVQLLWHDNSTNENYFNIWMQREYGPPQKIATTRNNPKTGPTRYDIPSPLYGVYNFWVEAVNGLGAQSSEVKQIWISERCEGGVATYIEIEALDMFVYGPFKEIYCYLSLDGTPEKRIPEIENIKVQSNWGDITKYWGGEKKIYFPMPADEELTIEGKCLGWQGSLLAELASFKHNIPRAQWDGRRLEINNGDYLVGYRIQPTGPETVQGNFQYVDYSLLPPQITNLESKEAFQFVPGMDMWPVRIVDLKWKWEGKPEKISGYLILMDGKEFRYVDNKSITQESFLLFSCGWETSFEVVAVGHGSARSAPSSRRYLQLPTCPVMAEVKFNTVYSDATDDQSCHFPDMTTCFSYKRCDQIDIYYELFALGAGHNPIFIKGGTENVSYPYKCRVDYQFTKQLGADTDTIIVPIDPSLPEVRLGTTFWESDVGPDDRFGLTGKDIKYPFDQWPLVDEDFILTSPFMDGTADVIVKGHIRGFVYPGP